MLNILVSTMFLYISISFVALIADKTTADWRHWCFVRQVGTKRKEGGLLVTHVGEFNTFKVKFAKATLGIKGFGKGVSRVPRMRNGAYLY